MFDLLFAGFCLSGCVGLFALLWWLLGDAPSYFVPRKLPPPPPQRTDAFEKLRRENERLRVYAKVKRDCRWIEPDPITIFICHQSDEPGLPCRCWLCAKYERNPKLVSEAQFEPRSESEVKDEG